VIRGTAAVGDGHDGSLSCEQRNALAGELLSRAAEDADRSCAVDADCAPVVARASCYAPRCSYAYVSERGRGEIERVSRDIDANLCADYEADACSHPLPKCMQPPAAVCLMGHCASTAPAATEEPAPSCNGWALKAGKRFNDAFQAADRSCMVDADCTRAPLRVSCREDCPLVEGLSQAGLDSLEAALLDIEAQECSEFEALGCRASVPTCDTSDLEIGCIQNVCTTRTPPNSIQECVLCLENQVQWESLSNARIIDTSTVEPCATYWRHRFNGLTQNEFSCDTELVACNAIASTGAIATALAHPDVQAVLNYPENPVHLGDTRDGGFFQVSVGLHQVVLGGSCEGAPPDCAPVPAGVDALREVLQQIDQVLRGPMGPCAGIKED
jgi:hypothetical protein